MVHSSFLEMSVPGCLMRHLQQHVLSQFQVCGIELLACTNLDPPITIDEVAMDIEGDISGDVCEH